MREPLCETYGGPHFSEIIFAPSQRWNHRARVPLQEYEWSAGAGLKPAFTDRCAISRKDGERIFQLSITSSRRRIYFIAQFGGMRVRFARQCRCHR